MKKKKKNLFYANFRNATLITLQKALNAVIYNDGLQTLWHDLLLI